MPRSSGTTLNKWELALAVVVVLLTGLYALRPIWDVDIFWHIAAGRWILEHRTFPSTDIFTFVDPPRAWVTFQWLYEVICAALDARFGLMAIKFLHAALTLLALGSFALLAFALARKPWLALAAIALLAALYADRIRARPHVFNLLFWSLSLYLLVGCRQRLAARAALLALISLLWSNLHAGGSFIFLVVLAAWPASAIARRYLPAERFSSLVESPREALVLFAAPLAAALLSPNWLRGVYQAYAMLGGSEGFIEEWLPFWHYFAIASHPMHYLSGLMPVVALVTVGIVLRQGRRVPLELLLVALGLTLLPFKSARFVFFTAFAVLLLAPYLSVPKALQRHKWVPAALALLLVMTTADYQVRLQFGGIGGFTQAVSQPIDERRFPVELSHELKLMTEGRETPLKVFCQPNWGGYLLYRLFPAIRVIADGRGNVSSDLGNRIHFIYQYRHVPEYAHAVSKIYDESGADVLVMQHPVAASPQALPGWKLAAASDRGAILVRR